MLWEKKHCYEKRGSDIYRKSTYATFFITLLRFLCFSKELAQFIVTKGCFISRKISLKVVNHLLLIFDNPWIAKTLTGQTWLVDIYAMLPHNVSFLGCFWRSHVYFIRYCNKPTEITRNHFCDGFLENQKYLREMFLRRLRDVTEKTSFLRYVRDVLKTSHKRHLFWNVFETS